MVERSIPFQEVIRKSFDAEYEKKEFLGDGSFGEVYGVVRKVDNAELAAKMIKVN